MSDCILKSERGRRTQSRRRLRIACGAAVSKRAFPVKPIGRRSAGVDAGFGPAGNAPLPQFRQGEGEEVEAEPDLAVGACVTFEPGARTAWHTHPLGQTLIVTAGRGRAQRWDGPIEEIGPGDVVWFPPGEKHWHGAAPTTAMTHIAIQEKLDGKAVDWLEQVSDAQYNA